MNSKKEKKRKFPCTPKIYYNSQVYYNFPFWFLFFIFWVVHLPTQINNFNFKTCKFSTKKKKKTLKCAQVEKSNFLAFSKHDESYFSSSHIHGRIYSLNSW